MYLLAAAFFAFGVYSAALGDPSHAMYAIGVGAVLAGARYIPCRFMAGLATDPNYLFSSSSQYSE
jgi:hypothetical protein